MKPLLRVLLYASAPDAQPTAVEQAYHAISPSLHQTPGLIYSELLRSVTDERSYVVMSEWASADHFWAWEAGAEHRTQTAPLRPYQDGRPGGPFGIYDVWASYSSDGGAAGGT